MRKVTLSEREWEHLKVVLDEDAAKRLKSVRNAGNQSYISDEQVQQRIESYQKTMELLRAFDGEKQEDTPNVPEPPPANDLFRI